jgi:thiol-disulfide isomerase/thioredoxin
MSLVGTNALEFPDGLQWLNSSPLKLEELRGQVVLIDFWTYSCINCIRTMPYLRKWYEDYSNRGLVIIGVHSPEFEFEKNPDNVNWNTQSLGIKYPVVLDNDHQIWQLYNNAFWPRKIIIDAEGKIVYDHIGEGDYNRAELKIQEALKKINPNVYLPTPTKDVGQGGPISPDGGQGGVCYPATQEYYLGVKRGRIGNAHEWTSGKTILFHDPEEHRPDTVYLEGFWDIQDEYIRPVLGLKTGPNYLVLKFRGVEVNLVASIIKAEEQKVKILLEGSSLTQDNKGIDVKFEGDESFINMRDSRMYRLVNSKEYLKDVELKIIPNTEDVLFYAFTFGGCIE